MQKIIWLPVPFILLSLASNGIALNENDPCINPVGQSGQCIYFRECDPIMRIYNKSIVTSDETKFVTRSQCGSTPDKRLLVCCTVIRRLEKVALPKPPHCGIDFSDRIIGGQRTALDEFPWAALIEYSKPNGKTGFHCGATLINSRYAVTAAHCIKKIPRDWQVIGVRLGEWDLDSEIDCLDGDCADKPVDVKIRTIIVHDDYETDNTRQFDDIALIQFTSDVNMTSFISPVCLPIDENRRNRDNVGTKGWAVGWGKTETGSASNFKQKVSLVFKEFQSCSETYKPAGVILRDTQLCAGGVRSQDTCSGDSGGALTKLDRSNHFLYGIVSFGPKRCGVDGIPGVYTNVAKYIEWIEGKME